MMQILAGCFIGVLLAALAVWHMPDALGQLQAMIQARREGIRVQRVALAWYRARLKESR